MNYYRQYVHQSVICKQALLFLFLSIFLLFVASSNARAVSKDVNFTNYKQISTFEYLGEGQFVNQVEVNYVVEKKNLSGNKVRYVIFPDRSDLESGKSPAFEPFSFIIDKTSRQMITEEDDFGLWSRVHNETVKLLSEVTKNNVGVTWIQSIDLSSIKSVPVKEINFTLSAIKVNTDTFGDMIAVRALSEPFIIKISSGFLRARMNTVYLFDMNIEDVYLSVSVFDSSTSTNGVNETLHHEVMTCVTDEQGNPLSLNDIGRDFQRFIAKIGLKQSELKVVEEATLPKWVHSTGLRTIQVANICSAAACEGALNPVVLISMPIVRILESQIYAITTSLPILQRLINGFGWNLPTFGVVGAAIVIPIAISNSDGGGHGVASPR